MPRERISRNGLELDNPTTFTTKFHESLITIESKNINEK
jgi:hypothetical protein